MKFLADEKYNGKISLVLESCQIVNSEEAVDFTPKIPTLVFDIETVGQDFETLDQREQEYLLNNLTVEVEDKEKAKKRTSLFAIFAMVAAIGGWDVEQNKGKVLMATKKEVKLKNKNFIFQSCGDEKQLLEEFWKESLKFKKFVTYNGSSFDFPFLIIRSGVNRVKVPMSIKRYDNNFIDLQEKIRQKHGFKLEFLCRAFGIDNPKEMGIDGEKVSELYQEGKFQEIANYVAADVTATVQLYQTWKEFMSGER